MKTLITVLALLATVPAFADFRPLLAKQCDDVQVPIQFSERVFIDLNQNILGFGTTEDTCRVVDFKSFVVTSQSAGQLELTPVKSIGRRSSCSGTDLLPYQGYEFASARVNDHSIELFEVAKLCKHLVLSF